MVVSLASSLALWMSRTTSGMFSAGRSHKSACGKGGRPHDEQPAACMRMATLTQTITRDIRFPFSDILEHACPHVPMSPCPHGPMSPWPHGTWTEVDMWSSGRVVEPRTTMGSVLPGPPWDQYCQDHHGMSMGSVLSARTRLSARFVRPLSTCQHG